MLGTVAAAILFATLANVLNLNHVDAFVQRVIVGLVLLLALSVEGVRQRLAEYWSRRTAPTRQALTAYQETSCDANLAGRPSVFAVTSELRFS
jgi:hypothetical protein